MFQAPSQAGLPSLAVMLDEIPASPDRIAQHLGISLKTLNRYRTTGDAPRAVQLALFWETRWGRAWAHAAADNAAALHASHATTLERSNQALRRQVERLEAELADAHRHGAHTAANAPLWRFG